MKMRRITSLGIALAISMTSLCFAQDNTEVQKKRHIPKGRIGSSEHKVSEERVKSIEAVLQEFYDNHANLENADTLLEIRNKIKESIPLIPEQKADTRDMIQIKDSLLDKVKVKFKKNTDDIRKELNQEAEKKFPIAKRNETVKVYYKQGRAVRSVTGRFYGYGLGGKSVRLNSRWIPLFDMIPESKALFNKEINAEVRKEYVREKMQDYLNNRQRYAETLFAAEYTKIRNNNERLGYIYYGNRWVSAEDVLVSMLPEWKKKAKKRAEKEQLEREAREKAKRESGQGNQEKTENKSDEDDE